MPRIDDRARSALRRLLPAAACCLAALYLGSSWIDERRLVDANAAGRAGEYERAIEEARQVDGGPSRLRARLVEANAALALGDARAAVQTFALAADQSPNDAEIRRGLATALDRSGRRAAARRQLARAVALDPGILLPPWFIR